MKRLQNISPRSHSAFRRGAAGCDAVLLELRQHAHPLFEKLRKAVELVRYGTLCVDAKLQADFAINARKLQESFPFANLKGGANVLIFPDLQSCNIAARILPQLGAGEALGPILSGMAKPDHLLQRGAERVAVG